MFEHAKTLTKNKHAHYLDMFDLFWYILYDILQY